MDAMCPLSGKPGKRVPLVTVRSLVLDGHSADVEGREWFFCDQIDCEVVYFTRDGKNIMKDAMKVRVGLKEKVPPRTICYCFGYTFEGMRDEIGLTGRSTARESIRAKVKAGECRCEVLNPKGTCCLGDVKEAEREAFASLGKECPDATVPEERPQRCCCELQEENPATDAKGPRGERASIIVALGSVLSAMVASACCWLPLLLIAFGASAAAVSAAFEEVRPAFMVITALLLGGGFYLAYFRKEACAPGSACNAHDRKTRGFIRVMLWVAVAVVLALAFFPNYVGFLLGSLQPAPSAGQPAAGPTMTVVLRIEGMSCEACVVQVEKRLAAVPGVVSAHASYPQGRAIMEVRADAAPDLGSLLKAVARAGYRARPEGAK